MYVSEGINFDRKKLTNLRFADDVALFNQKTKQKEKHRNRLNSESLKIDLKMHKGKIEYMQNYTDSEDIPIDQEKNEKVTEFKYLGQATHRSLELFWGKKKKKKNSTKEILQDRQLPILLKKQVMDQCVLPTMTYGCQTFSLNKQLTNKLRTGQRAMEAKMLHLKLQGKARNTWVYRV